MSEKYISVYGACEHNLKNINVQIPRNSLTVITGPSGSGKSSLAFDTIYAEGQRRYIESLSSYARQFLDQMQKPHVDHITGLSPAISIEQRNVSHNPRSTVGTVTEIYDYLRILYASIGVPHCPVSGLPMQRQSVQEIAARIMQFPEGARLAIMAPVVRGRKGEYAALFEQAVKEGYVHARIDGEMMRLGDEPIRLKKNFKHNISIVIDRIVVRPDVRTRLVDALELAVAKAEGLVCVYFYEKEIYDQVRKEHYKGRIQTTKRKITSDEEPQSLMFSEKLYSPATGVSYEEVHPRTFSFNNPFGACPSCNGLGTKQEIDEDLIVPDKSLSVREGAIKPWANFFKRSETPEGFTVTSWNFNLISSAARTFKIDLDKPWNKLPRRAQEIMLYGNTEQRVEIKLKSKGGAKYENAVQFEGCVNNLRRRLTQTVSTGIRDWILSFYSNHKCEVCNGERLNELARHVTIGGRNIMQFCALTVGGALEFIEKLELTKQQQEIAQQPLKEISERLRFMQNVGLDYLTLDRIAGTLAGGEAQRIRLATQIGSMLMGVLYVLDEPSIGLHQRDNQKLIKTLLTLRDRGNTVIVVEHDEETMEAADFIVDMGPGAGRLGGEVVVCGSPTKIKRSKDSITGRYLCGLESIPLPETRRKSNGKSIIVRGAAEHTLKNIDVEFPLGIFTCVTGVSGSGKSTLVNDILYRALARELYKSKEQPGKHQCIEGVKHIDKVIDVDQSPIGRTPRSNPATYIQVFSYIRDLFAKLPEARKRGYTPGRFSFNVKGGRCEACEGDGVKRIEMHFLSDVYVTCDVCNGRRYNSETLEVLYRGKNIADVLDMSVEEALEFFSRIPRIKAKLQTLFDVGLGYIHLGQQATTLSGGEAQRVKLSKELSKRETGSTFYVLDEPTTGLHFDDIKKLLGVLNRLVDAGNTVVVIEHNLDVIKSADWIIDLGPEGGEAGGRVIATGAPERIAQIKKSATGEFIHRTLEHHTIQDYNGGKSLKGNTVAQKRKRMKK
ncbi:excinuclease ABC subunit UvrA [Candidatus Sumerlaeota bacterium]|nr:excinuclease ABC subunit UvrA [Candidatus Sumerlaeota bacterium]